MAVQAGGSQLVSASGRAPASRRQDALSDRIGRRPLMMTVTLVAVIGGYPAMRWLVAEPSFTRLLTVELFFAAMSASTTAAWWCS